jgi:threonylcarbamoyladenosine tRNA methylthiotransferase MtaB
MKIYLDSIGCRLNQSEIERMAQQFRHAGHSLVASPQECDLTVINTCTVTQAAAADSRSLTRNAHQQNPRAKIVLTGCWASMEPVTAQALPGVSSVIYNQDKDQLVSTILSLPTHAEPSTTLFREPIPGSRRRTRAFIKVQDGCNSRCSFCVTTVARGSARSEPKDRVLADVKAAISGGAKEIVLSGVQLSAYGQDLTGNSNVSTLVKAILNETNIPRVRLSALEPWGLPEDFLSLWDNPRLCRQLHFPLQSGSERTLRRMGRPIKPIAYARLIDKARKVIPGLAVTTDIIVGFPGESEKDFEDSLAFIKSMAFSRMHVFTYSPRPGTAASRFPDRVPIQVARERNRLVRQVAKRSEHKFNLQFINQVLDVLWVSSQPQDGSSWVIKGLTDNYIRVRAQSDRDRWNQHTPVRLSTVDGNEMVGELIV